MLKWELTFRTDLPINGFKRGCGVKLKSGRYHMFWQIFQFQINKSTFFT